MTNEELEGRLRSLGHGTSWTAEVAARAAVVASMRASGPARVRLLDGVALVRVTLAAPGGGSGKSRTVTAGVDILSQLLDDLLCEPVPAGAIEATSSILREALLPWSEVSRAEVTKRADALLADPAMVAGVKNTLVKRKEKKMATERENLVSTMSELLTSGWTRDLLISSVDESVCRNVMNS